MRVNHPSRPKKVEIIPEKILKELTAQEKKELIEALAKRKNLKKIGHTIMFQQEPKAPPEE
jgi:hypothetical protein